MLRIAVLLFAIVDLRDGWQYLHTQPRSTPPADTLAWQEEVDEHAELELWYRVPLPATLPDDAQFVFRSYAGTFDIFLEQQRIYSFDEPAARGCLRLHELPLPHDARGKYLYVRIARGEHPPFFGGSPAIATRASTPHALVRAATGPLHEDLLSIVAGIVLVILGVFAIAVSRVTTRGNAGPLFWFGVFTTVYGLRALADSYLPSLLGFSRRDTDFVESAITYLINIPAWMLARQFIGDGWKRSLRWQVIVFTIFAPIGLVSDIVRRTPESLRTENNVLVIIAGAIALANLIVVRPRATRELRVVMVGAVVFLLFALINNLASLHLLPFTDIDETPGFLIFVAALGYAATRNFVRGERERLAIEGELATAREIQRSILPAEMPAIDGLRFTTRYVPASSVAGDVYDFVATDAQQTGVLVADVAGHGVPAALIASMVKVGVSSQRALSHDPAAMLSQLNQTLKREVRRTLVTATYLHVDMREQTVRVANAGHAPPLLLRNGVFAELGPTGVLLGRFGAATYTAATTTLQRGDRIVAWTDGIVEARNSRGEEFGEDRFRAIVAAQDKVADAVVDAVLAWRERNEDADDLTIVVIDVV